MRGREGGRDPAADAPPQLAELLQKLQHQLARWRRRRDRRPWGYECRRSAVHVLLRRVWPISERPADLAAHTATGRSREASGPLLRRVHGNARHTGRRYIPPQPDAIQRAVTLGELRDRLKRAIESEQFELAADIRDRIQSSNDGDDSTASRARAWARVIPPP